MPFDFSRVRLLLHSCGNFRCKVALFLLDALTQSEPNKCGDLGRCTNRLLCILESSLDGEIGVDNESLREKHDFLVEFTHAAIDHLLDDIFRLAGLASLISEDRLFTLNCGRINFTGSQSQRIGRSNVHCNLAAKCLCSVRIAGCLDSNQYAEFAKAVGNAIVDVRCNNTLID